MAEMNLDLAVILARHRIAKGRTICHECGQEYPCDVVWLAEGYEAQLDEFRAVVEKIEIARAATTQAKEQLEVRVRQLEKTEGATEGERHWILHSQIAGLETALTAARAEGVAMQERLRWLEKGKTLYMGLSLPYEGLEYKARYDWLAREPKALATPPGGAKP